MERAMLGVTLKDRKRSTWMREQTRVKVIAQVVKLQKWRWAEHVAKINDNRWTGTRTTVNVVRKDPTQDGRTRLKKIPV